MGIYRANLSTTVISNEFFTGYRYRSKKFGFIDYRHRFCNVFCYRRYIIAISDCLCTLCKVNELAPWKKYTICVKSCCNLTKSLLVLFDATVESVNCSLFLKNLEKRFCDLTYKKKTLSNTSKIYRIICRKNLSAIGRKNKAAVNLFSSLSYFPPIFIVFRSLSAIIYLLPMSL